jgi:hypothetical protein
MSQDSIVKWVMTFSFNLLLNYHRKTAHYTVCATDFVIKHATNKSILQSTLPTAECQTLSLRIAT